MRTISDKKAELQAKAFTGVLFSVYVHVPFCASICDFCAFYQEKPRRSDIEAYLNGIEQELEQVASPRQAQTLFWGGGTPGLLPAKDLVRLGEAIVAKFGQPMEWTVEMAPSTVKADKVAALMALGVTRVSMGVQSFHADLLHKLGRLHAPQQIYKAYDLLRSGGCENVNLDLIFAVPGQTLAQWDKDMREAIQLGPEHLSTYCLTFEEDTPLYIKLAQGHFSRDEEQEIAFYNNTWERLVEHGYQQYEVSNFAKEGHECCHNINTWSMGEWLGIGPSASSQLSGQRFRNPASLALWLKGLEQNHPIHEEVITLTNDQLFIDALIFGLRMNRGIDMHAIAQWYAISDLAPIEAYINRLCKESYAEQNNQRIKLTSKGRLVVDRIGSELLALF